MTDTTKEYASEFPELPYETWPTGQTVSKAGLGTYRMALGNDAQALALMKAIASGINLIDTSTNYSLGASESLIGEALKALENDVKRSDIVIITKIGYLQGPLLEQAKQREKDGSPYPDMVKISDDVYHCIHPEFLKEQLQESLNRMSTPYADALLLHNPEYYFKDPELKKDMSLEEKRDAFYARIKLAFSCMEDMVKEGKISYYGISSNSFPYEFDHPEFCSAERCLEIAQELSDNHHFRVIQFPFNLVEPEAAISLNQEDESLTLIEFAKKHDLITLVNRPLNGVRNNQLIRLSDTHSAQLPNTDELKKEIESISHASFSFAQKIEALGIEDQELKSILVAHITAINALQVQWNTYKSIDEWIKVRDEILGKMANALTAINQLGNQSILQWTINVAGLTTKIVNSIGSYYAAIANEDFKRNGYIRTVIEKAFPKAFTDLPLSQAAFNAVRTVDGISSVLIGARSVEYVDDVLQALQMPVPEYDRADWLGMKLH